MDELIDKHKSVGIVDLYLGACKDFNIKPWKGKEMFPECSLDGGYKRFKSGCSSLLFGISGIPGLTSQRSGLTSNNSGGSQLGISGTSGSLGFNFGSKLRRRR